MHVVALVCCIRYKKLSWRKLPSFHLIVGLFALGYALTNNMTVWITHYMDPALYQERVLLAGVRVRAWSVLAFFN